MYYNHEVVVFKIANFVMEGQKFVVRFDIKRKLFQFKILRGS